MPLRCYNCGVPGHRHRECAAPCWRCGSSGHAFVDCRNSQEKELTAFFYSMCRPNTTLLTFEDVQRQLSKYDYIHAEAKKFFAEVGVPTSEPITLQQFLAFAESRNRLLTLIFNEFDLSHSGSINRHEFKRALEAIRLAPTEENVRAMIRAIDRPSGPNGSCPPNGKVEFSEFRDFMLMANPSGRFTDFSLLADEWLEYVADEVGAGSAVSTGTAQQTKRSVPVWTSAVAGAIGNAFSRTVIAPLERVRMSMITDPKKYSRFVPCLTQIWKEEGVRGLWRGNNINVARIAPQGAIGFYTKDYFKALFAGPDGKATPLQTLGASMLSGIFCQTGVYPLDVIRTRMTTTPGLYTGLINGFSTILKEEGPMALMKGLAPANAFAVPYYGAQFFTYDTLKEQYSTFGMPEGEMRAINPLIGIPFGSIASCVACCVAFPLQMAWKRIQVQGIGGRPVLYTGTIQCISEVVKTEGIRGVYSGLQANLIKLAPTGAITFMAVEAVKDIAGWR